MSELKYEILLYELIHHTHQLSIATQDKDKIDIRYESWKKSVHAWICVSYKEHLSSIPRTKGAFLTFLQQPISAFGIPHFLVLTNGQDIPILMEDGLVHPFWLLGLEEREGYESPEAQHMKTLIRDIGALSSTLRGKMQASFLSLRDYISNPTAPMVFPSYTKEKMLEIFSAEGKKHPEIAVIYRNIQSVFDAVPTYTKEVTLCPYCGSIMIQKDGYFSCLHTRCEKLITKMRTNRENFEVFSTEGMYYFTFTHWVRRFIRIPGLEERKVGEETRRTFSLFEEEVNVQLIYNPDFDRADLLVNVDGDPFIQADIKDNQHSRRLVEILQSYRMEKLGPLSEMYIVVPNDITRTNSDYISLVENSLEEERRDKLIVVTAFQFQKVIKKKMETYLEKKVGIR